MQKFEELGSSYVFHMRPRARERLIVAGSLALPAIYAPDLHTNNNYYACMHCMLRMRGKSAVQ